MSLTEIYITSFSMVYFNLVFFQGLLVSFLFLYVNIIKVKTENDI